MKDTKKDYKINVKNFGYFNLIGFWTLYKKEVLRFLIVAVQTIISPIVTSLLFLMVLSLAIGDDRGEVLGFPFLSFLAPGLIAMQIIQQAFAHSSSSIMIGKIQGNIVDILYAPLSAGEITLALALASCTRGFMICIISIPVFSFFVELSFYSFLEIIIYAFFFIFYTWLNWNYSRIVVRKI